MKLKSLLLLLSLVTVAHSQGLPVLDKLDAAAKNFTTAQADVRYDNYTAAIKVHDTDRAKIYVERGHKSESMGAIYFESGSATPTKILRYDGGTFEIYQPGSNTGDIFAAGNNKAKYESFLTLGFGGSGKELAANWTITDLGSDTVAGVKCEKLDLVGKDASVRQMFTHITLWIDLSRAVSLRQIAYQPSGNTQTADYTNIVLGKSIDKGPFEIKPKKGAQITRH